MAFKKGQGGRPRGIANKVTVEARAAAEGLVDDPVYRAKLALDLRERKVAPAVEQMLWHYAKGKPKETIELQGDLRVSTLTDAELKARVADLLTKLDS